MSRNIVFFMLFMLCTALCSAQTIRNSNQSVMAKVDADGTEHYYRNGKEYKIMQNTNMEMGIISNLISDMTLRGAPEDDICKAVRSVRRQDSGRCI